MQASEREEQLSYLGTPTMNRKSRCSKRRNGGTCILGVTHSCTAGLKDHSMEEIYARNCKPSQLSVGDEWDPGPYNISTSDCMVNTDLHKHRGVAFTPHLRSPSFSREQHIKLQLMKTTDLEVPSCIWHGCQAFKVKVRKSYREMSYCKFSRKD